MFRSVQTQNHFSSEFGIELTVAFSSTTDAEIIVTSIRCSEFESLFLEKKKKKHKNKPENK